MTQEDIEPGWSYWMNREQESRSRAEAAEARAEKAVAERDELRRQLEQAKQVCAYWLKEGRFLVGNSPQQKAAVDMLRTVSNQATTP